MRTKNISNHSSTKNTNTMVGESASKKTIFSKKTSTYDNKSNRTKKIKRIKTNSKYRKLRRI